MPVAAKMHAFQAEVGSDQSFVPAGNRENCTVVTDAATRTSAPRGSSNAMNYQFFANWHRYCLSGATLLRHYTRRGNAESESNDAYYFWWRIH